MDVVEKILGSMSPGKFSLSSMEQIFCEHRIFTLASGQPNGCIKAYMYGTHPQKFGDPQSYT